MSLLIAHLYKKKGIFLRGLADTLHFDLPVWGQILTAAGAVVGTRSTCHALMEAGESILVYPGGANEVFKKAGADKYELQWKGELPSRAERRSIANRPRKSLAAPSDNFLR